MSMKCSKVISVVATVAAESTGRVGQNLRALGFGASLLLAACSTFCVRGQEAAPASARITNLKIENGNVVVQWEGGNGTSQVQCRTSWSGEWQDVGSPTSGSCLTNAMPGQVAFFRVVSVAAAVPAVSLPTVT